MEIIKRCHISLSQKRKKKLLSSIELLEKLRLKPRDDISALEEYKDLSETIRTHGNLRFAILTVFVAITGGLVVLLPNTYTPSYTPSTIYPSRMPSYVIHVTGILAALAFRAMEVRARDYHELFQHRAAYLEKQLSFSQHRLRAKKRLFTGTMATRTVYIGTIIFWSISLIPWLLIFIK